MIVKHGIHSVVMVLSALDLVEIGTEESLQFVQK